MSYLHHKTSLNPRRSFTLKCFNDTVLNKREKEIANISCCVIYPVVRVRSYSRKSCKIEVKRFLCSRSSSVSNHSFRDNPQKICQIILLYGNQVKSGTLPYFWTRTYVWCITCFIRLTLSCNISNSTFWNVHVSLHLK